MNYSGLTQKLQEQIHRFSGKLSTQFSVPKQRFIEQMVYGICAGQDVKLSEISRCLEEDVDLVRTEKRLSRNLDTDGMDKMLTDAVVKMGARRVHKDTLLVLDMSDITKPYAKKMEHLGKVRDGSTGEIKDGYWTCNVIACEKGKNRVVPLYQRLYSARAPEFKSENEEILHAVDRVRKWTSDRGIWVMDRGGAREKLLRPFLDRQVRFIVRLVGNRDLLFKGRRGAAREIALGCPVWYSDVIVKQDKEGEIAHHIRYGFRKVRLPGRKEQLYLIVVRGFGNEPMMLLTNVPVRKNRSLLWFIVGSYLTRWRIEDTIRFIKQAYKLEDIRVMKYVRLKNLVVLVLAACYFTAIYLGERLKVAVLARRVLKAAKRFFGVPVFHYYALADGIAAILAHATRGPLCLPRPPGRPKPQLLLFQM